jgi:hypothetical protein
VPKLLTRDLGTEISCSSSYGSRGGGRVAALLQGSQLSRVGRPHGLAVTAHVPYDRACPSLRALAQMPKP